MMEIDKRSTRSQMENSLWKTLCAGRTRLRGGNGGDVVMIMTIIMIMMNGNQHFRV
jgi:hypothetical protein